METRQSPSTYLENRTITSKVSTFRGGYANDSARAKKEDKPTSIIHGNSIDLSTLDIKPTNIFFYPPAADGLNGSHDQG